MYKRQVSEFPVTVGGKVDTDKLLKVMEQANSSDHAEVVGNETVRRICGVWKEVLGHQPDSLDATFVDSGGDSLTAMTFVLKLQEEFDLNGVGLATLAIHNTVQSLAALVDQLTTGATNISCSSSLEPAVTHFQPSGDTTNQPLSLIHI